MQDNVKFYGEFQLERTKVDGTILETTPWAKNIVLNSGLVRMGVGHWGSHICVGDGAGEPVVTQSDLTHRVATAKTSYWDIEDYMSAEEPHVVLKNVVQFGAGVAAGNLTEVGVAWGTASNTVWDVSRIRDSEGNPTTLTVLGDEFLTVRVRIYMYFTASTVPNMELRKPNGTLVSTHTLTGNHHLISSGLGQEDLHPISLRSAVCMRDSVYEGAGMHNAETTVVNDTTREYRLVVGTGGSTINIAGVRLYLYGFASIDTSLGGWSIDPPITKTDLQEFTLIFRLSWGRYTG